MPLSSAGSTPRRHWICRSRRRCLTSSRGWSIAASSPLNDPATRPTPPDPFRGRATVAPVSDDPTVELLRRLIRNRCVNDGTPESGHEYRSVETLADFFGERGQVFEPEPGRQSVVYRVAGTDPEAPSLALLPHLDVVPVNPAGWSRSEERRVGREWRHVGRT